MNSTPRTGDIAATARVRRRPGTAASSGTLRWAAAGQIPEQPVRGGDGAAGPDPANPKLSVFCFRDGILAAVESVNQPGDHLSTCKILAAGLRITREEALAEGFSLRAAYKERMQLAAV